MNVNITFVSLWTGGKGPGRGQPGKNAGAGHGGKGGLLFEDDNDIIYSKTYGIQPEIHLIGGSTGKNYRIFFIFIFSREYIAILGSVAHLRRSIVLKMNGDKNRRDITLAKEFWTLFCFVVAFFYTSLPFRSLQLLNLSVIQFSFRSLYRVSGSINQVDY